MSSVTVALPRRFASLVKIEHTLFALPFAYVGAFLAVRAVPSAHDVLWITVAMVGAPAACGIGLLTEQMTDTNGVTESSRYEHHGAGRPASSVGKLAAMMLDGRPAISSSAHSGSGSQPRRRLMTAPPRRIRR